MRGLLGVVAAVVLVWVMIMGGEVEGRRVKWREHVPFVHVCAGGISMDDVAVARDALTKNTLTPIVRMQIEEFLGEAARGVGHRGLFLVGAHRQGKTTAANILADALLKSSGRNVGRCNNAQCEVKNGKVFVSASSVDDPNWLLRLIADATQSCSMAVVIIDDLGLGKNVTSINSMFVVQKLLEGGLIPYPKEGATEYFKFEGLVIITANDYALETTESRNQAEICFAESGVTSSMTTAPYYQVAEAIERCVGYLQKNITELVSRAIGLNEGNVNPNAWGVKWTFVMFPLVMPCAQFREIAQDKWKEITGKQMPDTAWDQAQLVVKAKSPCSLGVNKGLCCYPTGHVIEATIGLANEWLHQKNEL